MKLIQKHFIKGTREFEIVDDTIEYRIKTPLKEEELCVVLSVLDPEPVIDGSMLAFVSQVNKEALVELFLDNPDKEEFDTFVEMLRQRIKEEDFGRLRIKGGGRKVNVEALDSAIDMLQTYLGTDGDISGFLQALAALKAEPENEALLEDMAHAFNQLGPQQGAILTYAPYISALLSSNEEADYP